MDINWTLLARERKLWRVIDENAIKRCFHVSLAQLPFFIWLFFINPTIDSNRLFWIGLGLISMGITCIHGAMYYGFNRLHGKSAIQWRSIFMWLSTLHFVIFGAAIISICRLYQQPPTLFLALCVSMVHCALLVSAFSAFKYGILLLLSAHLAPFIGVAIIMSHVIVPFAGLLLCVAFLVMLYESKRMTKFIWQEKLLRRDFRQLRRDLKSTRNQQVNEQHLSNEFLASLSREIRTPMNNVLGMLRLLSETELSIEQRRMQNIATASGENIVLLIDELLDLSKIIGHKLVLDSAVFNIRQCIDATINLLSPMAYTKNTELTHISDPDIPLRVRGDARRISQVLSNVVGFVIDYTEGGEISVNVHLTPAQVVEGILRIHVSSKNTMIPEKIQEEVQQLLDYNDNIEKLSPNHLGLEIAKGIVEAFRGSLGFVASGQNGVTFWLTMHITLSTQQTFISKTPEIFFNKRVLLVDMTPGLVSSIRNDAESWNMHIIEIQGYQRALELMREQAREGVLFDVAILNMALEYVGSLKLSKIMAEDPMLIGIKQIILCTVTQRGQNATLRHESKEFPCLFLTKPFSRGNLYHALLESFVGAAEKQKQGNTFGEEPSIEHGEHYRILLVEDNKVNQMVAQGLLKKLGYRAELCETGQDALARLQEAHFDLVLMDCNLPDTNGYEVTMAYRQFEEDNKSAFNNEVAPQRTAIIALTANVAEGEEARCFAAGMDDYLTKPIQADKMAIRLRTWLEKAPVQSGVIHTQHASKNAQSWSSSRRDQ